MLLFIGLDGTASAAYSILADRLFHRTVIFHKISSREGLAEEEALDIVGPILLQKCILLFCLHPFHHHFQARVLPYLARRVPPMVRTVRLANKVRVVWFKPMTRTR